MKNPAKPGDFGTNEARGVVLSGMSETRKAAIVAGVCWALSLVLIEAAAYCDTGVASNMLGWAGIWVFILGAGAAVALLTSGDLT